MYKKDIYESSDETKCAQIRFFSDEYKEFINKAKTERMAVNEIEKLAQAHGFKNANLFQNFKQGDRIYFTNRGKNILLFKLGGDITSGMKMLCAHIDAPRLDLKQNPVIESDGFTLFDTHYYGSIKNYQYVTIPLEIHGIVCKTDGRNVEINIGDDVNDPVIGISDLLVHLSYDQMQKAGNKIIESEDLDVLIGTSPYKKPNDKPDGGKNCYISKLINEKYNISEEDYISAEIEIVPAFPARDFGLDRTMIAGYGQDDRACVFASMRAMFDAEMPETTACVMFVDKEEIGCFGATSAESHFLENSVLEILDKCGKASLIDFKRTFQNSQMLSCDVTAALDPIYSGVSDKNNCAKFNHGIAFEKYLGYGGKCGTNDASPEYIAKLRQIIEKNKIHYQTAEFGRVDQGGAATISYIAARYNMDVVDCGIPILNMHSPMEIISKADLYEAYMFYKAFLQD